MSLGVFIFFLSYIILANEAQSTDILGEIQIGPNIIGKPTQNESIINVRNRNLQWTPKLICFYVFTDNFKPEVMKDLCTHIIVGFFVINNTNHSVVVSDDKLQILSDIVSFKKENKDLKVLICVGGAGVDGFSSMAKNHTTRKMFIRSAMQLIKKYHVDGIDLDWEWPVVNGDPKEKIKFIQLLYEIREEFKRHKKEYILSVDVGAIKPVIDLAYYIQYMAEYVNFVNVMCYDYHFYTKWYPFTGLNAPLYTPDADKSSVFSNYNINYSINYWISNSMPRDKVVLGLPTFGHSFKLASVNKVSLRAPASGYGTIGQNGFVDFIEICEFIKRNPTIVYDLQSKVPYAHKFPDWVSYDNEISLAIKASYVLKQELYGAMVFSVNSDDYLGVCNGIQLPLIRIIRSILFNEV